MVALRVAKDYNNGQRTFVGTPDLASGFVFACFARNTNGVNERFSFHGNGERFSMEQLDTDIEYVSNAPRPSTPAERLSILYIFPILGVALVLFFTCAIIFQWNISALVDNLVVLMVVLFFVFTGIVFWGLAPRSHSK